MPGPLARCAPPEKAEAGPTTAQLRPQPWANDPALQVKVSFEARRQPLGELLAELQKQSGIAISAEANAPAQSARVTARAKEMPLAEVMSALSRLYDVSWAKNADNVWLMRGSERGELEQKLQQLGDLMVIRYRLRLERMREAVDWMEEISPYANHQQLKSPAGVRLSELPEELQLKIRRDLEPRSALTLLERYRQASEAALEDYLLFVTSPKPLPPDAANPGIKHLQPPRIAVATPNRQTVAAIPAAFLIDIAFKLPTVENPTPRTKR